MTIFCAVCCLLFFSACPGNSGYALFEFALGGGGSKGELEFCKFPMFYKCSTGCQRGYLTPEVPWVCEEGKPFAFLPSRSAYRLFYTALSSEMMHASTKGGPSFVQAAVPDRRSFGVLCVCFSRLLLLLFFS